MASQYTIPTWLRDVLEPGAERCVNWDTLKRKERLYSRLRAVLATQTQEPLRLMVVGDTSRCEEAANVVAGIVGEDAVVQGCPDGAFEVRGGGRRVVVRRIPDRLRGDAPTVVIVDELVAEDTPCP